MSIVAVFLIGLAVADTFLRPRAGRRNLAVAALAIAAVEAVALLAGLTTGPDLWLQAGADLAVLAWALVIDRPAPIRLALLGGTVLALVLASGWASPVAGPMGRWLAWSGVPHFARANPTHLLLIGALLVAQLATGNTIVRLVLTSVGALKPAGQPQAADRIRGGRLLGPMERLFIVGLALAGDLTAAGLVIAAKGLIRWPELQARSRDASGPSIDEVTEYFLIGSFTSWLFALASVVAAHLA